MQHILVLIPAHNQQDYIAETIRGVQAQSRPADRIIVVPNNCRDDYATAAVAAGLGAEVIELHGITGRKAGALNAALDISCRSWTPTISWSAWTPIPPLTRTCCRTPDASADPRLGAVSSNHLVDFKRTAIELLQAMEYERDRRMIGRRKGRYGCMTGMAAITA